MITMKEIAALANVSQSTVSHALHGRTGKMSKETLERVQRIIKESNYVANMTGRSLAKYGSKIIAVIKIEERRRDYNMTHDPFFAEVIGIIEHEVQIKGYFIMLYVSADVNECIRMAKSWNVEGMIIHGSNADGCAQFMKNSTIPLVFLDSYFHNDGLPYVNIGLDDRQGGYDITKYLIRQGHKKIAFLADIQEPIGDYLARREGCQKALKDFGLQFTPDDYISISTNYRKRHEDIRNFARNKLHRYTALFFVSDFLAADAISIFHDEGIRVPHDVSVCGFDDNIYALQTRPRLTTIHQDVPLKVHYAVQYVLRMIHKEPFESRQISLPVSLIIRDSVKKLN
ncbi:MAG: LacI family transcriptional regulator [Treponema sp.]|nr:LacI family transcriptional regulator [Treponema sp.]